MKNSIILKVLLVMPIVLFIDYILMGLIGCSACILGFGDDFYNGFYCIFGKIILGITALFFVFLILPELVEIFKNVKNVTTTEKQESL